MRLPSSNANQQLYFARPRLRISKGRFYADSSSAETVALNLRQAFTQAILCKKKPISTHQLITFCFLLSISNTVFADPPRLLHDPFLQPVLKRNISIVDSKQPSESVQNSWLPHLTSTLRAGKNSMVIVSNRVMQLGEVFEGYQLIRVNERTAVFLKNDKQIRLSLDGNE